MDAGGKANSHLHPPFGSIQDQEEHTQTAGSIVGAGQFLGNGAEHRRCGSQADRGPALTPAGEMRWRCAASPGCSRGIHKRGPLRAASAWFLALRHSDESWSLRRIAENKRGHAGRREQQDMSRVTLKGLGTMVTTLPWVEGLLAEDSLDGTEPPLVDSCWWTD